MYKESQAYIDLKLEEVSEIDRPAKRLELDFAAMLIGPTCGAEAKRLASYAIIDPLALALAMKEAAERYLQSQEK